MDHGSCKPVVERHSPSVNQDLPEGVDWDSPTKITSFTEPAGELTRLQEHCRSPPGPAQFHSPAQNGWSRNPASNTNMYLS